MPNVTPYVGVWIETDLKLSSSKLFIVTPYVGVWIETYFAKTLEIIYPGHTLRGCVD